jgi:putative rhamnosyltransferase
MAERPMFSSQRMKHFIITPFYVRRELTGKTDGSLPSTEWLDHRLQLFEDYCLPSVVNQSSQNFEWFIYFDESTPARYLERIGLLTTRYRNIRIKLCAFWESPTIIKHVVAALDQGTKWVMTSRLDNDDGLHRDYVAMLHSAVEERTEFLNFPRGIILYSGKCYIYEHRSNAFLTFVEPAESPRTAFSLAHEQAVQVAPVRQLGRTPAFLQVVHGKNVSNKPRGTRIHARRALVGFEAIRAVQHLGSEETFFGVLVDNMTAVLMWRLRDLMISVAKVIRR